MTSNILDMVDTVNEDTGMANTDKLRTLIQDQDEWRVCFHARRRLEECVSQVKCLQVDSHYTALSGSPSECLHQRGFVKGCIRHTQALGARAI